MTTRRKFLKTAGIGTAATLAAPAVRAQGAKITWRLQTYAGPALAEQVVKPMVEKFNAIAGDQMRRAHV